MADITSGTLTTRPSTPLQHDPSKPRDLIVGPDSPEPPYPVYLEGWVTRGFGRGSKDLGTPTANLPDSSIEPYDRTLLTGVYYGYARVLDPSAPDATSAFSTATGSGEVSEGDKKIGEHDVVWPMVMSIGWNPYYNNTTRTAEVHILHDYPHDFYSKELRVIILGFIRPEYNYNGLDALIKDIETDKQVALTSAARPAYLQYKSDPFFARASKLDPPEIDPGAKRVKPGEKI